MNIVISRWVRTSILGLSMLASGAALAHGYGHHRDRDDDDGWRQPRWDDRDSGYRASAYDYARVIDVDPIVRRVAVVAPRQECWTEQREGYGRPRSATPTILGAIVGGVVGHQFGSGGSRDIATVAGAILGGSVGRDTSMRDAPREVREVERCAVSEQRDWVERVEGYRVRYVYRGREYCTTMAYDPGSRVQVRVGYDIDVVQ